MLFFEEKPVRLEKYHQSKLTEYQAVVLCGYGNRLNVLTEDDNLPKALLPIANRPMIWYVIDWLIRGNIHDIILVSQGAYGSRISHIVRNLFDHHHYNMPSSPAQPHTSTSKSSSQPSNPASSLNIDHVVLLEGNGSLDALRQIKDRIKHDFILLGCDFVSDIDPHAYLDFHRNQADAADITACFFKPTWESIKDNGISGYAWKHIYEKEIDLALLVGIEPKTQRLAMAKPMGRIQEDLSLRMSMCYKFPQLMFMMDFQDAHLYMVKRAALDYILLNFPNLTSFREDVLPLLCKRQYKRSFLKSPASSSSSSSKQPGLDETSELLDTTWNTKNTAVNDLTVMAYLTDAYTVRANTVQTYAEVNRHLIKPTTMLPKLSTSIAAATTTATTTAVAAGGGVHKHAEVNAKSQLGSDTLIGEQSRIDEKCSIKRSVIGSHCVIGKNVKLTSTIIMDNVVLEDKYSFSGQD